MAETFHKYFTGTPPESHADSARSAVNPSNFLPGDFPNSVLIPPTCWAPASNGSHLPIKQ